MRDTVVVLGIPVDNLTMDDTVGQIFEMIESYQNDKKPRLVATVNVDFIVNTLTWGLRQSRHPELLDVLRRADLVTADGAPVVWASKLLGVSLKGRITGADLVPRLAEEAVRRRKSIYFLGGRGDVGKRAAAVLEKQFPGLIIAGAETPFVYTEGEVIVNAESEDKRIIEHINQSGADILLIGFGNPKQEIWFERNRRRLHVPVSIGIGGTYDFIVGTVARAPLWMQEYGLEWIFRITQDPKRLWKRYFVGLFKLALLLWPSILYYKYRRMIHKLKYRGLFHKEATHSGSKTETSHDSSKQIKKIIMPVTLDATVSDHLKMEMDRMTVGTSCLVLDFEKVGLIDSSGLGLLISIWRKMSEKERDIYIVNVNHTVERFMKLNRTWDIFKGGVCGDMDEVRRLLKKREELPRFYYSIDHLSGYVQINLNGRLDAEQMSIINIAEILESVGNRDCILGLINLNFVDSSGIVLFLKLQKRISSLDRTCMLCGMTHDVRKMFEITRLDSLFHIADNISSARKALGDINESRNFASRKI